MNTAEFIWRNKIVLPTAVKFEKEAGWEANELEEMISSTTDEVLDGDIWQTIYFMHGADYFKGLTIDSLVGKLVEEGANADDAKLFIGVNESFKEYIEEANHE